MLGEGDVGKVLTFDVYREVENYLEELETSKLAVSHLVIDLDGDSERQYIDLEIRMDGEGELERRYQPKTRGVGDFDKVLEAWTTSLEELEYVDEVKG